MDKPTLQEAKRLARKLETGAVFINSISKSHPLLTIGGIKKSGFGRELSHYGIKEFVNIKGINVYEVKKMKASDLFIKCLENEEVEYIFGVPGEENEDIMISLIDSKIKFIPTRHEQELLSWLQSTED